MTSDLSKDLQQVIEQYLAGGRSRSLATLARSSGVAYTTLRRFAQVEGNPTAEPVMKVLDATLGSREKVSFLEKHFPGIAGTIATYSRQSAKGSSEGDQEPQSEALGVYYRRIPHNFILNLAINDSGTSVATIQRLYGERGLSALDELVECQVLVRDHGTGSVRYVDSSLVIADPDLLLTQLRFSVEHFDRDLLGTEAARIGHLTSSLNHKGLKRVHEIMTQALAEIYKVNEDPACQGEIPYYAGAIMNIYDKKPFNESRES